MVIPKPIRGRKLDTSEWIQYPNANKAASELGIQSAQVYKCCKKERTHTGGYEFEFDDEAVPQNYTQPKKRRIHEWISGIEHTKCSGKCKKMKSVEEFNKCQTSWDGLSHACKECLKYNRDINAEHYKEYRQQNKKHRAANHARWYRENKQRVFKYMNDRYHTHPDIRLKQRIGHRIREFLKGHGIDKKGHTLKYVGCTIEKLQCYIEKQFDEYMTWNNMGKWHLDHRIPCTAFDTNNIAEATAMWHYTNLQPMWASENFKKKNHYDPKEKAEYMRMWREYVV